MLRVFVAIICLALAELVLLVVVGRAVGLTSTLLVMLVTAIVGVVAARAQGLSVFRKWLDAMSVREQPEEGLVDGLLVVTGGTLLVLPGFLGDVVGLLLLIAPLRRLVAERIRRRAQGWVRSGDVEVFTMREVLVEERAPDDDEPRVREIIDVAGEVVDADGAPVAEPRAAGEPIALLPRATDR